MADEKQKPYVHQEFPKMVYDHEASSPSRIEVRKENGKEITEHIQPVIAYKIVADEKELAAALKEGFVEEAPEQHPPAPKKEKAPKAAKEPKKGKKGEQSEEASE